MQSIDGIQEALYEINKSKFFSYAYPIFDTVEELHAYLEQHPLKDRYILLKGSRSTKMETLLDIL